MGNREREAVARKTKFANQAFPKDANTGDGVRYIRELLLPVSGPRGQDPAFRFEGSTLRTGRRVGE